MTEAPGLIARNFDPAVGGVVLTSGTISGGTVVNGVAASAKVMGTLRFLDSDQHDLAFKRIRQIADGVALATGATADVRLEDSPWIPLTNDPGITARFTDYVRSRPCAAFEEAAAQPPRSTGAAIFVREARVASELENPHILRVFDMGKQNGRLFIVMELLNGQDLRFSRLPSGTPVISLIATSRPIGPWSRACQTSPRHHCRAAAAAQIEAGFSKTVALPISTGGPRSRPIFLVQVPTRNIGDCG